MAVIKGIDVVGTGDFTHPGWLSELEDKLQPEGNGFYSLKQPPAFDVLAGIRPEGRQISFCLSAEVNCEYVEQGIAYKNHHLIYAPDVETARRINSVLSRYGNLAADGRPTLNMKAHELFSRILEIGAEAYFIPAHVWTPWYSVLGSKNGHSSLQDCFGDLTSELFAAETSLSADPLMCRLYTGLDHLTLLSNSDAHTAHKLGREVNLFDTELSYAAMFNAIKTKKGFLGTYEYYPQRGKYYNNGHRNCNISGVEGEYAGEICPVCHQPLTIGVAHRVAQLADRNTADAKPLTQAFSYVLPLPEIFAEINGVSEDSKKVQGLYAKAINYFGNEFNIVRTVSIEDLQRYHPLLATAVDRLRKDEKHFTAGYDGAHGRVHFFKKDELDILQGKEQLSLF